MPEQRYIPLSSRSEKPLPPLPNRRLKWLIALSVAAVCAISLILFWTSPLSIRFAPRKWFSNPYTLTSLDPNRECGVSSMWCLESLRLMSTYPVTTVITTFEHPTKFSGSPPENGGVDPWEIYLEGQLMP